MKRLKLFLFIITVFTSLAVSAQVKSKVLPGFAGGSYSAFGTSGYSYSPGATDTLAVTDSVAYIYQITGGVRYVPFISLAWTKIGAGTATVTCKLFQSNQGGVSGNYQQCVAGLANTAYSKSFTFSATGVNYLDAFADSVKVSGRFLKVQFYTSGTANVQGSIAGTVNTTIR